MKGVKRVQSIRPNRINREIRATEVRLTDVDGEYIGIFNIHEALEQAEAAGVDLVEISPNATPPVCRVMDYGKFIYEKNKSSKEQKKKQKVINIKEIKFRPNTNESDYQVKLRNLIKFLENGDKVKITLRFRGREVVHQQIGMKVLHRLKNDLNELSIVEYFPSKIEGRQMIMLLSPKKI
ncbi:translation initiation factor IF-3 [Candidatus Ishikawella capsulata]|uniref:Translation initiation factor IF-3 n=1 Tax=Candidatus Ishikawaella capsulata Mpkobe TaxID=476281 RepID=C5WD59_9ENTR|nr:translation initiation factor IF-3 [Candidatus Ishikawaella capsulata]BAH83265.1 translation initiation factor IF-3 [Candidatus Ishikawaella capsulata Mpkobe]